MHLERAVSINVRQLKPLLVNTVVGFIGTEYLYDGRQAPWAGSHGSNDLTL